MQANYPNGFNEGVLLRELPAGVPSPRRNIFVGNNATLLQGEKTKSDSSSNNGTFLKPYSTLDYAVGQAKSGDFIFVRPGHTETVATATALALDVAGITVVGLGVGASRPTYTVNGAATATVTVSGNNTKVRNVVFKAGLDGLNSTITVTGTGVDLDIEHQDTSSTVEADIAITCTGDQFTCRLRDIGFTAGDQRDQSITLNGVDNARIDIDFYGKVATAVVDMVTAACTDVEVRGNVYVSGTTDGSKNVVDTITGSTWYMDVIDAAAGARYTGGSAAAVASDDISAVNSVLGTVSTAAATGAVTATDAMMAYVKQLVTMLGPTQLDTDTLGSLLAGTAGIATIPNAADPANNVNAFELLRAIWGNLCGTAAGENGITTFPAGAAPGNNVSLAEVIRYISENLGAVDTAAATGVVTATDSIMAYLKQVVTDAEALMVAAAPSKTHPNYFTITADMTSATWNTVAAHEIATVTGAVRAQIMVEVAATVITTGTNGTIALGFEGNTSAIFSATALDAALTGDVFSAVYGAGATTPASGADAQSSLTHAIFDVVAVNGMDIGYTIATNAATTGTLTFHVWWQPLSATGAVVAGAGGPL